MRILMKTSVEDCNVFREGERLDGKVGRQRDDFRAGGAYHLPDFQGAKLVKLGFAEEISEDWQPPVEDYDAKFRANVQKVRDGASVEDLD